MKVRTMAGMISVAVALSVAGFSGVAEAQSPNADPPANENASQCRPGGAQGPPGQSEYPPGRRGMAVDRGTVPRGGTFGAEGCGQPDSGVRFTLFSHPKPLGSVTTDATGFFRASFTIPCDTEEGAHTVRTTGGLESSAEINVTGATGVCVRAAGNDRARGGGDLPRSGSSSTAPLAAAGIGLVLIGAGTAIAARRRRSADTA